MLAELQSYNSMPSENEQLFELILPKQEDKIA
jgi:hypothetical protein